MKSPFLVFLHLLAGSAASVISYPMRMGASGGKFTRRFEGENLFTVDVETRQLLEKASQCLSCGRCEYFSTASESAAVRFPVNAANFIMDTRSINDVNLISERLKEMRGFNLAGMEKNCPVNMPFTALVDRVEGLVKRRRFED
ncbi:MAG: hypothetical protein ABIJ56_17555 [Pseudomonadota bacterium]